MDIYFPLMCKCRISLFVIFLIGASSQSALADDFLVEEDLRLSWLFYDESEQLMLPFLDNSSENPSAIHLQIEDDYSSEAYLRLKIPIGTSIFIQNKFIEYFNDLSIKLYSIDSLRKAYSSNSIRFTFFNKDKLTSPPEAEVGFMHKKFDSNISVNPIGKRNANSTSDFIKVVILLVFTFFVLLHTLFKSDLFDFLSLQTMVTFRYTETALYKYRSLTKTQTLVIVYFAAMLASIIIVFLNYVEHPLKNSFILKLNPLAGWFLILLIVLVFIFLKFLLISMVSLLFKIGHKINFYLIEFLRMSMIFYSVIFVILSYSIINHFYYVEELLEHLIVVIIVFNLIRLCILFFKFRRTVSIKSLHLFSYLCTTELIPIVLGLNFFLK